MCQNCGGAKSAITSTVTPLPVLPVTVPVPQTLNPAVTCTDTQSIVYRIENLVINNYGHIAMLTDKPAMATNACLPAVTEQTAPLSLAAPELKMVTGSTERWAKIGIQNNLPVALKEIKLAHMFSGQEWTSQTWYQVSSQALTLDDFTCKFWTGSLGTSYWKLSITFEDGTQFETQEQECQLTEDDESIKGSLLFQILGSKFEIQTRNSVSSSEIIYGNPTYDTWAFLRAHNNLPVAAVVEMSHQHGDTPAMQLKWDDAVLADEYSAYTVVYGHTGSTMDRWNVQVRPNVATPMDTPSSVRTLTNEHPDQQYWVEGSDCGACFDIDVSCEGWRLNVPSSPSSGAWKTTLGHNMVTFVQIRNYFRQDVRCVVLKHSGGYSEEERSYAYPTIPIGHTSNQLHMIEFSSGFGTSLDSWNITAFLKDETYYQNDTQGKECYLQTVDAGKRVLNFVISESRFELGLAGACSDGMHQVGMVDYLQGADLDLPYNQNCYLAGHNAFANFVDGYWLANQGVSIETQLAFGATTLLLDIWADNNEIYMLQNWRSSSDKSAADNPFIRPTTLLEGLSRLATFINTFDDLVVTLVIEDKIDTEAMRRRLPVIFERAGLWNRVYQPLPEQKNADWPTLRDMIYGLRKRLVVFTSQRGSDLPYQWDFMTENTTGDESITQATWTKERVESLSPYTACSLMAMNHYPTISTNVPESTFWEKLAISNEKDSLSAHVEAFQQLGIKAPNFINMDFVEYKFGTFAARLCNDLLHGSSTAKQEAAVMVDGLFMQKRPVTPIMEEFQPVPREPEIIEQFIEPQPDTAVETEVEELITLPEPVSAPSIEPERFEELRTVPEESELFDEELPFPQPEEQDVLPAFMTNISPSRIPRSNTVDIEAKKKNARRFVANGSHNHNHNHHHHHHQKQKQKHREHEHEHFCSMCHHYVHHHG